MMIEKRFNIVSSEIVEGGKFIQDNNKEHSFPTTIYPSSLVMYEKALNELSDENEQLKKDLKKQFVPFAKADGNYTTVNTEEFIKILNENEQLKQEKQELFDFFMNEYDRQEDESIDREIKLEEHIKSLIDVNEQLKQRISELKEDNDHKFWKLQFMHQFNTTELIVHEIGRAIEQGYEVSDKFQEYLNELKVHNEKGKEKAIEQEKWGI